MDDAAADGELAFRAAAGDDEAFVVLFRRHYPWMLRYACHMIGERADAEEAVQDAFLRAHGALRRYDDRSSLRAWLQRILVNRCRTYAARRSRRARRVEHLRVLAREDSTGPEAEATLSPEVASALQRLPAGQREALLLKFVEELSYDEMAMVTGAGVSALKMRVARAREHLSRLLGSENGARA